MNDVFCCFKVVKIDEFMSLIEFDESPYGANLFDENLQYSQVDVTIFLIVLNSFGEVIV